MRFNQKIKKNAKFVFFVLSIWAVILVAGLILGELYMRSFHPQVSTLGLNYLVPDDKLRYKHMPNCKLTYSNSEMDADFFTNSQGFRDVENYEDAPESEKILFLGDSFTFGFGVKQEEVFSAVLQKKLKEKRKGIAVVNAGAVGYGTDQEYIFLKESGINMKPKLVIINIYANDLSDNVWRSIFYLDPEGAIKENPPLTYSNILLFRWFLSQSHLFIYLTDSIDKKITETIGWDNVNGSLGVLISNNIENYIFKWPFYKNSEDMNLDIWKEFLKFNSIDFYQKKYGEKVWDYGVNLQEILIKKTVDALSEKNIPYLFTLIPAKEQTLGNKTPSDGFQEHLSVFFEKNDIPFINLNDYFASHPDLYFERDVHWNKKGHEFFSNILYDHLSKNGYLKKGSPVG